MSWLVLIFSGALEAVWAAALHRSKGFRKPIPSVVFVVSLLASTGGLAFAMRSIPTGTAYAVWVGVGVVLTAAYAMITKVERPTAARLLLLAGIGACVVGLKVVA
ncbi:MULTISPECIES: multidrug efflux SMR transporter [Arthrobacter]|uniref:Multidrug efflux SMR transporter n=1 Tax=Arthrobacter terricola TaxID=2547396 RepID=A0A4R5KR19_9MICC|nr:MULTISPECIES: multidrug efflux SMR transporter [Arthrobacter]MBT8160645.1 multidrug efflux SMR transporter [Arthrobacter sp. GN70]TDF97802.1 multidrug efflux SMR transporter [Arthrobacter terricola]